ncbi:MAG: hypothetical protein M3P51_08450, partial [Chloroflexota bacterium]|nr:hypothetical protein [Chloroflexota bacterium]
VQESREDRAAQDTAVFLIESTIWILAKSDEAMQSVEVEQLPTVVGSDRSLRGLIRILDLFALVGVALAHNSSNLGGAF